MVGHSIILTSKTKSFSRGIKHDSSTAVYFLLLIKLAPPPIKLSGAFYLGVGDICSLISANVWLTSIQSRCTQYQDNFLSQLAAKP